MMNLYPKSPRSQKQGSMILPMMKTSLFMENMKYWRGRGFFSFHTLIGGLDPTMAAVSLLEG